MNYADTHYADLNWYLANSLLVWKYKYAEDNFIYALKYPVAELNYYWFMTNSFYDSIKLILTSYKIEVDIGRKSFLNQKMDFWLSKLVFDEILVVGSYLIHNAPGIRVGPGSLTELAVKRRKNARKKYKWKKYDLFLLIILLVMPKH